MLHCVTCCILCDTVSDVLCATSVHRCAAERGGCTNIQSVACGVALHGPAWKHGGLCEAGDCLLAACGALCNAVVADALGVVAAPTSKALPVALHCMAQR